MADEENPAIKSLEEAFKVKNPSKAAPKSPNTSASPYREGYHPMEMPEDHRDENTHVYPQPSASPSPKPGKDYGFGPSGEDTNSEPSKRYKATE